MEELALVRVSQAGAEPVAFENNEPIADINFNRKKMLQLEQGIDSLQKSSRQNTQVVSHLELSMKAMISETDLRRAIGLAFQEFEHRLEDAFTDSNRKCLAMFSRRDDVQELQAQLAKRITWAEFNSVIKKLADLKHYIDTMAESVFIGHREALFGEFAKKADRKMVEEQLRSKADIDSVNEVRARLERLEVLVSHQDALQSASVQAVREDLMAEISGQVSEARSLIQANFDQIAERKASHETLSARVACAESEISSLGSSCKSLREVQKVLQAQQDDVLLPQVLGLPDKFDRIDSDLGQMQRALQSLAADASEFRNDSLRTVQGLSKSVSATKEHVDFLLQETEMIKRRAKELSKKQAAGLKDVADGQEKVTLQLQAIERDVKKQARDVRAIDNRTGKDPPMSALEGLRALPASFPSALAALPAAAAVETDGSVRLKSVMEQLEKLAFGDQFSVPFNPERPPLPTSRQFADSDLGLPRFSSSLSEQSAIDSARGNAVGGMYGLSPRGAPGRGAGKKKR